MRADKYEALLAERSRLKLRLGDRRAIAPVHQRYVLTPSWRANPAPMPSIEKMLDAGESEAVQDVLELKGEPIFTGPTLDSYVEDMIRAELKPAYKRARAEVERVSQLHLSRRFKSADVGPVPVLGEATEVMISDADEDVVEARFTVAFDGDSGFFRLGLPGLPFERPPLAGVSGNELIFRARFSRGNEAFVRPLLEATLEQVEQGLVRQRRARQDHYDGYPEQVKRVVAGNWASLEGRQHKR